MPSAKIPVSDFRVEPGANVDLQECLSATSTKDCPWHIIPADDKKNARLIVSELVIDAFNELKMSYPEPSVKRAEELAAIRKGLME